MASQAPADSMTSSPGVTALLEEHAGLEARLADPDVHADPALARSLGRRYAALAPVVATVARAAAAPRPTSPTPASSPARTPRSPPRPTELAAPRRDPARRGWPSSSCPATPRTPTTWWSR